VKDDFYGKAYCKIIRDIYIYECPMMFICTILPRLETRITIMSGLVIEKDYKVEGIDNYILLRDFRKYGNRYV